MRHTLPRLTAALAFAAALSAVFPAAADDPVRGASSSPFSEAERTALHAEIRAYLLDHPDLLMEMVALLEQRKAEETAQNDLTLVAANADAIFDDGFSWVGGNPQGSFTVVEFLDYQCGYCRRAQPDVRELIASDGDIRLIVKEMPILGPGSELAARAAIAAAIAEGPETYAALHERLMTVPGQITDESLDVALAETGLDPAAIRAGMNDPEVDRRLAETRALAEKLAISGTPTFVFEDRMVRGYVPLDGMRGMVEEIRTASD